MELCTIVISKELLQSLVDSDCITTDDFEIKLVDVKDDYFKDDERHKALKKASDKAYKDLKAYEFCKRHNIKEK